MADRALPGWPRGLCEELAAAYVGLSVTTIRAERAAGRFPAPIPLTRGRIVWLKEDLDRYLDEKAGRVVCSMDGREWMEA
ncbi:MAG: helix-turn-helix domain-containing protein [Acetobacteraceae bacterium]|nr:helix-turn-helix domain-containing protein [Acetobacteraceae bacterium]